MSRRLLIINLVQSQKNNKSSSLHPRSFNNLCTDFSSVSGPQISTSSSLGANPEVPNLPTSFSKSSFPILPVKPVQVSGGFVNVYNSLHFSSCPLTKASK